MMDDQTIYSIQDFNDGVDLLKKLTNIKPKTNYKEGVRKFIEWYLRYHKI